MYQNEFQPSQKGLVGLALNGDWAEPYSDTPEGQSDLEIFSATLSDAS